MVLFGHHSGLFFLVFLYSWPGLARETIAENSLENENDFTLPAEMELSLTDFGDATYETVVEARRFDLSAGTKIVSREELDRNHSFSTDEIVRLIPGVSFAQHGAEGKGQQIYLRGFDAAHGSDVEVLLHGIPLNEPSHVHGQGYLDLYGIIPEVICEMAVYKGPHLPWQGNFANAGSLRFSLCAPGEQGPLLVRGEVSHRGRLRGVMVAAPDENSEGTYVAVETVYDHGISRDREGRRAVMIAGYEHALGRHGILNGFLSGQISRFETPGAMRLEHVRQGRFDFLGSYGQTGEGRSDRLLGRIGFEHEGDDTDFEVFLYGMLRRFYLEENFTGWIRYADRGDRKAQEQQGPSYGAEMVLEHKLPFSFPNTFLAGVGWRLDDLEQKERQLDTKGVPWQTGRNLRAAIHQVKLYAGLRFSPVSWLELYPSVRLDLAFYDVVDRLNSRQAADSFLAVSPRVAIGFPLHKTVTLFADYGRGFRLPEARAVVATSHSISDVSGSQYRGGRPRVSSCDSVEVGVGFRPLEALEIRALGFGSFLAREMVFDHVSNMTLEMNGTRRLGVEAEVTYAPLAWITSAANFSWLDARFSKSGHPVPGVPTWIAKAGLTLGRDHGPRGGVRLFALGKRHLAHGAEINGYLKADIDFGWRFDHFEVTGIVENVLNQNIAEGAYHYASWFERQDQRSAIPAIHYTPGVPLTFRAVFTAHL